MVTTQTKPEPTPAKLIDPAELTAAHEFGHGLLALELQLLTRWMSIRRHWDGGYSGMTEVACDDFDAAPQEGQLLLIAAGTATSALWLRRVHHWPARDARAAGNRSAHDDRKIFQHYAQGSGYTLDAACQRVTPIVIRNWDRLERCVGILVARRKMKVSAA